MEVTIDGAGRIVIPMQVRVKLALNKGTKMVLELDDDGLRLRKDVAPPIIERCGKHFHVRPADPSTAPPLDIDALIREERDRWPL
jgi:AbrB family looped-hinge helix DNA binding protein